MAGHEGSALLNFDAFLDVVRDAPLISIDLIVENLASEVLLGLRRNQPAAGYWFVPGGRVHKGETLDAAFHRICHTELGRELERSSACFAGEWEHFYPDNAGGVPGFGTHYVVLAYRVKIETADLTLPIGEQHDRYRWVLPHNAAEDPSVHRHTRDYFAA
ncbi:GDP-mannose mannosyl hydrolase [Crenobacter sp. SG2305]|uniref:GDP-mannose mannosyl hydrolase n=1 Tax=Crenobacter oryzisoli TaxID=3056844 RepID=UPI0025AA9A7E|nr:GDP-mannose mannosyl hydrolase [Crenobacter sp. SG2305]MDN0084253.1 GDP-mannose mannosyl hydrolase [Crenobacter sp. SG2305]